MHHIVSKNPVMGMKILSTVEMSKTDVATCIKKHNNNNKSLKFKSDQTEGLEHRVIKKSGRKKAKKTSSKNEVMERREANT